jgi:hypothetical protein
VPTPIVSGLGGLVRGVRVYFEANAVDANVSIGWTARYRQDNQGAGGANRVIFIPGEDAAAPGPPKILKSGAFDLDGAQNFVATNANGERLRTLAWNHEPVTVSVWAVDPDRPQDEEAQYEATILLVAATIQAIYNAVDPQTGAGAGYANIEAWGDSAWTLPPGEMAFGRERTFGLVLLVPYFDAAVTMAYPGGALARGRVT